METTTTRRFGIAAALAVAVAAAGLGSGCRRREDARVFAAAVEGFFQAAAKQDCAATKRATAGDLRAHLEQQGCDGLFEQMEKHGLAYQRSTAVKPDGRAPQARILEVRLRLNGKERDRLLRVEQAEGAWKLASL